MVKIWAKTYLNDKIKQDMIYSRQENFNNAEFFDYVADICHEFDIPTPVILKSHIYNFHHFNITKFRATDFIESVYFDNLVLENAIE